MKRVLEVLRTVLVGVAAVVIGLVVFFAPVILWWCIYQLMGWKW